MRQGVGDPTRRVGRAIDIHRAGTPLAGHAQLPCHPFGQPWRIQVFGGQNTQAAAILQQFGPQALFPVLGKWMHQGAYAGRQDIHTGIVAGHADGSIVFWDHETDDITTLAPNWNAFVAGCAAPTQVELDERDVRSVWIDPEFAKEQGVDAPPDGWLKKPKR